jgi:hypothetical protein
VERVHPVHLVILAVAILGAVFAFVAMRVAFDARDAAVSAASSSDGDNWYEINQLQQALVRAGVIEDPDVIPDDYGELDGPWSRCLTADERDELGLGDEVELPPACDTVPVSIEERCVDEVSPPDESEADDVYCEENVVIDGLHYNGWLPVHPVDVTGEEWLLGDGSGIDRVARRADDVFVHVVGEGWRHLETYR